MINKILIFLSALLLILLISNCPETPKQNQTNYFDLSGDIIVSFIITPPEDITTTMKNSTVLLKVLQTNDPSSDVLYSTSISTWRIPPTRAPATTFYASYSITGIPEGSYLYGKITSDIKVNGTDIYGPELIPINTTQIFDIKF